MIDVVKINNSKWIWNNKSGYENDLGKIIQTFSQYFLESVLVLTNLIYICLLLAQIPPWNFQVYAAVQIKELTQILQDFTCVM